jgi:hypothetical protein
VKARPLPSERRLARVTRGIDPATLREASVRHVDARRERLEAYEVVLVASLRDALQKDVAGANAARFERQLQQVRKEVHAASRSRVPRLALPGVLPLLAPLKVPLRVTTLSPALPAETI